MARADEKYDCFSVLLKDGRVSSFLECAVVKDKGSFGIQWLLDNI